MIIKHDDCRIRYTGRWNVQKNAATSTANGNYFEFAYNGEYAVIEFDIEGLKVPFPHVYISVDGGANIEVSLDKYIRISSASGDHKVCVIMKGSVEIQNRWLYPIEARVSLVSIEAEDFCEMPEDTRPIIEFIGDSITEGISIDVGYTNYQDTRDMIYWDDSTAGYAWLTAQKLNFRPVIMGYGCLGTTKGGAGNIPPVGESYLSYSDGFPMPSKNADYIIINHGTNDRISETDIFKQKYFDFLCTVRKRNPKATIISLTPFSGCLVKEIKTAVEEYNHQNNDDIFYINTTGWINPEPVHPLRDGHKIVSQKLSEIIREQFLN